MEDYSEIDSPESDYLFIQKSQLPNAGEGLFTAIDIYQDEIISVFTGEILTEDETTKRISKGEDQYFINMVDGSMMDSMHTPGFAKKANDAEGILNKKFKNNSKITLNEEDLVCLVATRDIEIGEEIFCGYGKKYWKKHK